MSLSGGEPVEPLLSATDFRRYFYTCLILAFICFAAAIVSISSSGYANVDELSIMGHGTIDARHASKSAADTAMIQNATVVYEAKREWGGGSKETLSSSFIVSGASPDGGYRNQYVVKGAGAEHKVEYRATQISGDFSGNGEIVVTATEYDTGPGGTLESTINMDSRNGEATFQGRVYNAVEGRPATIEELDAVGQFVLRSYLNISYVPEGPEDWLGFCAATNRDMILDTSVPTGIYIAPPGYYVGEDGQLRPDGS